ncbi:hypothetical protein BU15DRAFT_62810 [Melanogaster broomeanus]|nr:hypothetical protein BU15DRAFT_62810 [Melanogaster broomeanus]
MSDTSKQNGIEELLRKSFLGEELIDTQFHLFSTRLVSSGRVGKPRVLCTNNILLTKDSKYMLDLSGSETKPSDPFLVDIADSDEVPSSIQMDDYGYDSDSDLDDEEPPTAVVDAESVNRQSASPSASCPQIDPTAESKDDDEVSDDGSENSRSDEALLANQEKSDTSIKTTIQVQGRPPSESASITARLRSLGSRHILVKDTAFQTWYTLLNYLYTGKVVFLPLRSSKMRPRRSFTSTKDEPKCSAKSMYRLASKVCLDCLRDEAFDTMRSGLTEHNILRELSCSLVSRYRPLLEMELDILYLHIASPPVVAGLPAFVRRIANKELSHGADIIVGLYMRVLKEHYPRPLPQDVSTPLGSDSTEFEPSPPFGC